MLRSKAYKIKDARFTNWETEVKDNWVYDDFLGDNNYIENWISITSLVNDEANSLVYLGIGSFSGELLYVLDRKSGRIENLNYKSVAQPYDAKFHCSLAMDDNGDLYGAVAQFHDVDKQFTAKGGRVICYSPGTKTFRDLGTPVPGSYIQSIALDRKRRTIYGYTLSPEFLFRHDLASNHSEVLANVGNSFELCQTHNPVIDDSGRVWGTYGITRAFSYDTGIDSIRLFVYDPSNGEYEFLNYGLPRLGGGDKGQIDRAINGGDGYLYFGGVSGSFSRLNPQTGEIQLIGKPCENGRLAGLYKAKDGFIYGTGGDHYYVTVFRYDPQSGKIETLGRIFDESLQEAPVRTHSLVVTEDGTLYAGENDNNIRSSYLWECKIIP